MKLNIGCGYDKRKGYINMDITNDVKPDVVHNLLNIPYPFEDNAFDYILMRDVLEHIPKHKLINVLEELYRISKHNTMWDIRVPFYNNNLANSNLLHYGGFDFNSFNIFLPDKKLESSYSNIKLEIISVEGEPTSRGKFIPFKMFLRHSIGELYVCLNFKLKIIK